MYRIEMAESYGENRSLLIKHLREHNYSFSVISEQLYYAGCYISNLSYIEIIKLENAHYIQGFLEKATGKTIDIIDWETGEILD